SHSKPVRDWIAVQESESKQSNGLAGDFVDDYSGWIIAREVGQGERDRKMGKQREGDNRCQQVPSGVRVSAEQARENHVHGCALNRTVGAGHDRKEARTEACGDGHGPARCGAGWGRFWRRGGRKGARPTSIPIHHSLLSASVLYWITS